MISPLDASSQQFLADLERIQERSERAQRQLATGLRIVTASDAPDEIGGLLHARADLGWSIQSRQNLERVNTEIQSGELAISSAIALLDRASTLGSQGASGTQTADTRKLIAGEVESILGRLVALSNTTVEGRYIFGGDADQTAPYTLDPTSVTGITPYLGAASSRQVEDANGVGIQVARTAEAIFADPGGSNVFEAVNDLRNALDANDALAAESALLKLQRARNHLGLQQTFYGTAIGEVNGAIDGTRNRELSLRTSISAVEEADLVEASLALNQSRIQQEAALAARARLPRTSLFDYLG